MKFDNEPWFGDLDGMIERRIVRVVVPYSRTLYYNDHGRERGIAAGLVRDFEAFLNKKYAARLGRRPITVYIIPATRDVLLTDVVNGLADIAAGNLTATAERLKRVDFVAPKDRKPVSERVLTGPSSPTVMVLDDLAGKRVHVRKSSSYYSHLTELNQALKSARKPEIRLIVVPDALEDEDLMEMLNAGLVELIVVDDVKAQAWAQVLPRITVTDIAVAEGGYVGWAFRKGSPMLASAIEDSYVNWTKRYGIIQYRMAQFHKNIKQISNSTESGAWSRFEEMLALFQKYGTQYGFDPLMLAAQGYQESKLDQRARSRAGAIGVMQLMPATGTEMKVGDITVLEANIHAGAKYMDHLMNRYFADASFNDQDRALFALASYNAGPSRIARLRRVARDRGLDANRWFNNVELVVAEKVGIETTTYVRNIFKYHTAYVLQRQAIQEQHRARQEIDSQSR